jgi:hypothetical protein
MTSRLNEVDASMNTIVDQLGPVDAILLLQIRIETRLNVVYDGLPAAAINYQLSTCASNSPILIVNIVAESRSVHNGQLQPHTILLNIWSQ